MKKKKTAPKERRKPENLVFAARLQEARHSRGFTVAQLADRIGIHWRSLSRYENTKTVPKAMVLARLADALGVSMYWLIGEDEMNGHQIVSDTTTPNPKKGTDTNE